jgi:hypothetical protein
VILVSAFIVLAVVGGAGLVSAGLGLGPLANLLKDSGLESCKAMADQKSAGPRNDSTSKFTADDYKRVRAQFVGSRYSDIRVSGTHFVDVVWQAQGARSDDLGAALMLIGPLVNAYSDLAGACANHGVVLPPLTS